METAVVKVKITQAMVGQPCLIFPVPENYNAFEWGEYSAIKTLPGVDQRSIEQNNLYFACLGLVVEHKQDEFVMISRINESGADEEIKYFTWDTKDKAHSQVRWLCGYIDRNSAVYVTDKRGNSRLYFELDSVSFSKSRQKKVNEYYDKAFVKMAELLGITVEELIAEAQSRMKARGICKFCGSTEKITRHHKLSQTKLFRELYPEFIDHPDNIIYYCINCHENKSIINWTELEFCHHFKIKPRSTELLQKIADGKIKPFWKEESVA